MIIPVDCEMLLCGCDEFFNLIYCWASPDLDGFLVGITICPPMECRERKRKKK
jgi:hypothetical protein